MGGFVPDPREIVAGNTLIAQAIQSQNFVTTIAGWQIAANGNAEFNNVTVRGTLSTKGPDGSEIIIKTFAGTAAVVMQPPPYVLHPGVVSNPGQITATIFDNAVLPSFSSLILQSPIPDNRDQSIIQLASQSTDGTVGSNITLTASRVDITGNLYVGGVVPGAVTETVYTASGTFTPATGAKFVRVRCVGGGGGGGGAVASGAATVVAAPGGQGGGYAESLLPAASVPAGTTVTVGAAGTAAVGAGGGNGGTTSFGALVSADGGAGGALGGAAGTLGIQTGAWQAQTIVGTLQSPGAPGSPGMRFGTGGSQMIGGNGGNSVFGLGGQGTSAAAAGAAQAQGGGGAGASSAVSTAARAGGAAGAGLVIVTQYF